jgi:acyl carrier protein
MSNIKILTLKDTETLIRQTLNEVYLTETQDNKTLTLSEETVLLETGLDSLGYAILVTRLEEEIGYDPFTLSSEAYYPLTFGELVLFYFEHMPK